MPIPRNRGARAPKPATSARGTPDNADFVGITTHHSHGLQRRRDNRFVNHSNWMRGGPVFQPTGFCLVFQIHSDETILPNLDDALHRRQEPDDQRIASRAVTAQYEGVSSMEHVYPLVRSKGQLDKAIAEIEAAPGIVLFTLVDQDLAAHLEAACKESSVPCLSVLQPIVNLFQSYIGTASSYANNMTGGGQSSAISRRMSVNRGLGMAT